MCGPLKLRKSLKMSKILMTLATKVLYTIPVESSHQFWLTSDDCITLTTMGVSSASYVLHRLVGLTLDHALNAAKHHAEKNVQKKMLCRLFLMSTQVGTATSETCSKLEHPLKQRFYSELLDTKLII